MLSGNEQCDDGNRVNDDGCDMNCNIEIGWRCFNPQVSRPSICRKESYCGDGSYDPPSEQCDDGNSNPNDGCRNCNISADWQCTFNRPGYTSQCSRIPACGNGFLDFGE